MSGELSIRGSFNGEEDALGRCRVALAIGERSAYGRAHLEPLLAVGWQVAVAFQARPERWERFRQAVHGPATEAPWWRRLRAPAPSACAEVYAAHDVPVWTVDSINAPEVVQRLSALGVDYLISAAYPQIFGTTLLAVPTRGAINFHPSLLPEFRGAHPVFWAIREGAEVSGGTAHWMTRQVDEGDLLVQRRFSIRGLRYGELQARMVLEAPRLVADLAVTLREGRPSMPQDPARATTFRGDREADHRVQWMTMTASEVVNLCRTERAFATFNGRRFRPWVCTEGAWDRQARGAAPGTVLRRDAEGLHVRVRESVVIVRQVRGVGHSWPASLWARWVGLRPPERFDLDGLAGGVAVD